MIESNPYNEIPAKQWVIPTLSETTEELSFVIQSPSGVSSGGVGLAPWSLKTSNYTAVTTNRIAADTTAGVFTITLPASPAVGDNIELLDAKNTWETNNLTVARNGQNIAGSATDLTCDTPLHAILVFIGGATGWGVY